MTLLTLLITPTPDEVAIVECSMLCSVCTATAFVFEGTSVTNDPSEDEDSCSTDGTKLSCGVECTVVAFVPALWDVYCGVLLGTNEASSVVGVTV